MNTTLTIENIYNMLSSLSVSNKKWLADHLYEDISGGFPSLDMNDYAPLTDEQFKGLIHSRPVPQSIEKWL